MGTQPIKEVDWDDFGLRVGNGPSYLLFRKGKVYELRTTAERDIQKLLRGSKVLRKSGLMALVWDLHSVGGALPGRDQRILQQIERIMLEPTDFVGEIRIDELAACLHAARKLIRKIVPKGPITRRFHDSLPLELLLDNDGEPNAILDSSEFYRREREVLLGGKATREVMGEEFALYECVRPSESPIARLAQELARVPTKQQLAAEGFSAPKDKAFISHYCRERGFGWLPMAKPGRPRK
jgi:hypothetical protein